MNDQTLIELLETVERITKIQMIIRVSIAVFGMVGNTFMFLIYSRPKLERFSLSTYFRFVAVVNFALNSIWIAFFVAKNFNFKIQTSSPLACKLTIYLISLTGPMSSWLEVAAGLDRFFTIIYPGRFDFIRKVWFRRAVVSALLLVILIIYAYLLFEYDLRFENHTNFNPVCRIAGQDPTAYVDLICACLLPFGFMVFSSAATLFVVIRSREKANSDVLVNTRRRRDIKFGITIIFLNLFFLTMSAPIRFGFLFLLDRRYPEQILQSLLFQTIATFLYDILHSGGFYLQVIVNSLVRIELVRFIRSKFCCRN